MIGIRIVSAQISMETAGRQENRARLRLWQLHGTSGTRKKI